MFMVGQEDVFALYPACDSGGRENALVEGRRRWPFLNDGALTEFVERVLAMLPEPPPSLVGDKRGGMVRRVPGDGPNKG